MFVDTLSKHCFYIRFLKNADVCALFYLQFKSKKNEHGLHRRHFISVNQNKISGQIIFFKSIQLLKHLSKKNQPQTIPKVFYVFTQTFLLINKLIKRFYFMQLPLHSKRSVIVACFVGQIHIIKQRVWCITTDQFLASCI